MAKGHSIVAESGGSAPRSILQLMLVALVLALAFDALSTALVWDLVRVLPSTAKRATVRAVRPADVREASRPAGAPVEGAEP